MNHAQFCQSEPGLPLIPAVHVLVHLLWPRMPAQKRQGQRAESGASASPPLPAKELQCLIANVEARISRKALRHGSLHGGGWGAVIQRLCSLPAAHVEAPHTQSHSQLSAQDEHQAAPNPAAQCPPMHPVQTKKMSAH